jgi:D-alanine transaminase
MLLKAPMPEIIWFNGRIMSMSEAHVSVEDRGFQFADGVYEAMRLYKGRAFALDAHLARLERSASGIKLAVPMERAALAREIQKLVDQSGVREGVLYLQLTRGACPRHHVFPKPGTVHPTLFFYARQLPPIVAPDESGGYTLWSVRDERWRKCWIKAICLTASALARNEVDEHGADEAVFVDENGIVAEGASSNLFTVIDDVLVTHPIGSRVLPGITRAVVLECARQLGTLVDERPLHIDEAKSAREIFITSTTRQIVPVFKWDDRPVGGERCGRITMRLHEALEEVIRRDVAGAAGS